MERISIFFNLSISSLIEKMEKEIKSRLDSKNLNIIKSIKELVREKPKILYIINGIDIHENEMLIFNIIDHCKKNSIIFYILQMTEDFELPIKMINSEKKNKIEEMKLKLKQTYSEYVFEYSSYEGLFEHIYSKLIDDVKIKIKSLYLENIGHFDKLKIDFDDKLTVFIGLNGYGKTTILKSLVGALIGFENKNIDKDNLGFNFLKIKELKEKLIVRDKIGIIEVEYSISQKNYKNKIELSSNTNGEIDFKYDFGFEILTVDYLKSLIVGFNQIRGEMTKDEQQRQKQRNQIIQPNIYDILGLLNNKVDNRLQKFSSWIADLYAEANKKELEYLEKGERRESSERAIINKVFEIISKVTDSKVSFLDVRKQSTEDVWVKTEESPGGIPIELLSLGFQSVIGWIGYFVQRLAEVYLNSNDFTKEFAILIIDEIDTYLHPKWQSKILNVLLETFPNVQIILSTQSPIILNGLNKEQIILLDKEGENGIVAKNIPVDIWAWQYSDILRKLFGTFLNRKYNLSDLKEKLENYNNKELTEKDIRDKESIENNIRRIEISELYNDELRELKERLIKKEKELDELMNALKLESK